MLVRESSWDCRVRRAFWVVARSVRRRWSVSFASSAEGGVAACLMDKLENCRPLVGVLASAGGGEVGGGSSELLDRDAVLSASLVSIHYQYSASCNSSKMYIQASI